MVESICYKHDNDHKSLFAINIIDHKSYMFRDVVLCSVPNIRDDATIVLSTLIGMVWLPKNIQRSNWAETTCVKNHGSGNSWVI
jgi:hypothetical protein